MITIEVTLARRRFGRRPRNQWRYKIVAGNGEAISEKDTYANPGDLWEVWHKVVNSDEPVRLRVHQRDGQVSESYLRGGPQVSAP
jgi:hypothetical protein